MAECSTNQGGLDTQTVQELVYYAGLRFRLILLEMKKPQKGLGKRQKWMEDCLRQELVRIDLINYLEYF
jgi:hypothetical protein